MQSLLVFVFLTFACYQTLALTCYDAHSGTDDGYKPKDDEILECPATSKMCLKITAKAKIDGKTAKGATFSCDILDLCNQKGIKAGKCGKIEDDANLCCCDTDKCNSSRLPVALSAVILPILVNFFH